MCPRTGQTFVRIRHPPRRPRIETTLTNPTALPHSPPGSPSDLVRRAQSGDVAAFECLYHEHVGRVYALCVRMVADTDRAELLTQDTFVLAWQRLKGFRGDSTLATWLHRIAVNVVLNAQRTDRRRTERIQPTDDVEQYSPVAPGLPADARLDLEGGIAALPERARTVLVLHDVEGYRHDEIGRMMGIAPGTSKAHLHHARQLLKRMLNR